jgi:hypothetical protein
VAAGGTVRRPCHNAVARVAVPGLLLVAAIAAVRWTGLDAQTDAAVGLLGELGCTNVERVLLPGRGHDPAADQVLLLAEQTRDR